MLGIAFLLVVYAIPNGIGGQGRNIGLSLSTGEIFVSPNLALSVHNVTKNFGGLTAVDQITFDVMEHDVVGLIGPNGSGKTTMLNVISECCARVAER